MKTKIYQHLLNTRDEKGAGFIVLLDPDNLSPENLGEQILSFKENGADLFLVGGSLLLHNDFNGFVRDIKTAAGDVPVILFPGSIYQVSPAADAILFLSVISGRNPAHLIDSQVLAAPMVWKSGIEAISCAYMLIESGRMTTAEFMSNSKPLPRHKPDLALAHALAAQYLGFKTVYLEGGSGAELSVPEEIIATVSRAISLPVIVGGGIRTPEDAAKRVAAGASFIVIGNHFQENNHNALIREFADAIHQK